MSGPCLFSSMRVTKRPCCAKYVDASIASVSVSRNTFTFCWVTGREIRVAACSGSSCYSMLVALTLYLREYFFPAGLRGTVSLFSFPYWSEEPSSSMVKYSWNSLCLSSSLVVVVVLRYALSFAFYYSFNFFCFCFSFSFCCFNFWSIRCCLFFKDFVRM